MKRNESKMCSSRMTPGGPSTSWPPPWVTSDVPKCPLSEAIPLFMQFAHDSQPVLFAQAYTLEHGDEHILVDICVPFLSRRHGELEFCRCWRIGRSARATFAEQMIGRIEGFGRNEG